MKRRTWSCVIVKALVIYRLGVLAWVWLGFISSQFFYSESIIYPQFDANKPAYF